MAERLRGHIADAPISVSDGRDDSILVSITVSVGVAELASARQDLDDLLAAADAALYQAKNAGQNRICVVPPGWRPLRCRRRGGPDRPPPRPSSLDG